MAISLESTINSVISNENMTMGLESSMNSLVIRIRESEASFAVSREISTILKSWPENSPVTYGIQLANSHNAMNIDSGIFTSPLDGTYTFVFYATMACGSEVPLFLYATKNQEKIQIFQCKGDNPDILFFGKTVLFTMELKAGDQVGINSGNSNLFNSLKFSGFLEPSI